MSNTLQKSFLIKGATCSGKELLPKELRKRGVMVNAYGIGNDLRRCSEHKQSDIMKKGDLLSDEYVEHLLSERVQIIGNEHPFFGIGLIRTIPQIEIVLRVLRENGFAPPTVIHLKYSVEYCRKMRLSRLSEEEKRDDSDLETCERRWRDYYDTESAIIADCKARDLSVYTISDEDKMLHIEKYLVELGLSRSITCSPR